MHDTCKALGICALAAEHTGAHIPDHTMFVCLDRSTCRLCIERTTAKNVTIGTISRYAILYSERCENCPVCGRGAHDPSRKMKLSIPCSEQYVRRTTQAT